MSKIHKPHQCMPVSDVYFMKHHLIIDEKNKRLKEVASAAIKAEDDNEKAVNLLQSAKAQAEQIISAAREEAKSLIENARKDAYECGYEEGKLDGIKEFEAITQEANNILKEMLDEKYGMLTKLEPDIMKMCIKITEKILHQQVHLDKNKFICVITNAIQKASDTENMNIYVSQEQYDGVNELKDLFLDRARKVKNIQIFKDEVLENLDCLIETDCEVIDLGVMSQIKKIEQAFKIQESAVG